VRAGEKSNSSHRPPRSDVGRRRRRRRSIAKYHQDGVMIVEWFVLVLPLNGGWCDDSGVVCTSVTT